MGMSVGNRSGSMSEPNIVPLIDVLLVLIIIFMVITPTIPQGLDAQIPQSSKSDSSRATIVLQVTANGKLLINQEATTWDALGPRLEQIYKQRAEKVAFVKGDDGVEFAQITRAIDVMRGAGIDNVGLISHSF